MTLGKMVVDFPYAGEEISFSDEQPVSWEEFQQKRKRKQEECYNRVRVYCRITFVKGVIEKNAKSNPKDAIVLWAT